MNFKNLAMWAIIVFLTIGLYNMFKNPQSTVGNKNQINFSEITLPWENKNPSFAGLSNPEYKESKYGFGVYSESALCWEVTECHHIDKSINYNSETFFKKFTTQSTP